MIVFLRVIPVRIDWMGRGLISELDNITDVFSGVNGGI